MRGMIQWRSRTPPAKRWHQEKCSRAGNETPVTFLILCNPALYLLLAECTRRRQLSASRAQPRCKKQDEFLFFFGRQLVGGSLDFGERAHSRK
jgi:hypothetical protein